MHHVIPQQFNQSDKIGRFTMPQFIILAAITTVYVLIVISSSFVMSLIALFPLAILAFVLMYFKVNKIPIYEFLFIYLIFVGSPKLLVYRSDNLKSIEDKEEGIGFIDMEKPATKSNNKKSEKKDAQGSKSRTEKQKKKSERAPKKNEKSQTRNQKPKQRGSKSKNVLGNKGVKK